MWPVWSLDSKIDCISRMNRWNNWYFACWYRFTKTKSWSKNFWVGMVKNGCEQSGHRILKLNVSQKWTDRINWFFACWYKFRKAESWFNNSWVGMVKNNHDLFMKPENLLYFKKEFLNWADLLYADSDAIIFG